MANLWTYQSVHPWVVTGGTLSDQARLWLNRLQQVVTTNGGGGGGGVQLGGDLGGTNTSPLVIGIEGRQVSAAAPTDTQVLTWVAADGQWEPKPAAGSGGSVTFAGDLTGTNTSQTVIGLRGRVISTAVPLDAQVLTWSSAHNNWEPQAIPGAASVEEVPSGTLDGANVLFTLSFTPVPANSLTLYLNGVEQIAGTDYTASSTTLTYTVAPKASDLHIAEYTH